MDIISEKTRAIIYKDVIEYNQDLFDDLLNRRPETRDTIVVFGKSHELPRYQKLYGNGTYRYSNFKMKADPEIPNLVQKCIDFSISKYPDFKWNAVLVNWYIDGKDYVSWHADDERDLNEKSPILSFSFGHSRVFKYKGNKNHGDIRERKIETLSNSCIVMEGDFQKECIHCISKTSKKVGPRINITVRSINT